MALFPSLSKTPHLGEVFQAFPAHVRPLLEYHDLLLRGDSPLSIAERELIATYVSGLNACTFCFGAHKIYAKVFGVEERLIDDMMVDLETSAVDEKMKPILHYTQKLTKLPAHIRYADAQAIYEAGWGERALYDAIQICALFNFMNRIIEGTGVSFDYAENPPTADELESRKKRSYMDYGRSLGIIDQE
jgi:uncharacterized peroxidase-related enzyme